MKEQMAKEQIELTRYRTLLENEKQKVTELEQERNATDKSDLEDLLDNTRMEKVTSTPLCQLVLLCASVYFGDTFTRME